MEVPIKTPNIPSWDIKLALCDNRITREIYENLSALGIKVLYVSGNNYFDKAVNFHPDMLFCHVRQDVFVCDKILRKTLEMFDEKYFIFDFFNNETGIEYPENIKYNAARVGDFLFCYEKYTSKKILENFEGKIINVKQGYSKCSIAVVNEYSLITEDEGIKKAAEKENFDVLLIQKGFVKLKGYNYGFIGGSCGLIGKNKLAFYGDLRLHTDYKKIHDFLYRRNIEEIYLSKDCLYDYGSLIPLA